jgi:hypothetical protein
MIQKDGSEKGKQDFRIGGLDAWRDDYELIQNVFIPIEPFTQLLEPDQILLCGRRGSGKSAIAIKCKSATDWDFQKVIQGETSEYASYIDLVDSLVVRSHTGLPVDVKRVVKLLWDYVLRILVLQTIVEQHTVQGRNDEKIMRIQRFLRENGLWEMQIGEILTDTFRSVMAKSGEHEIEIGELYSSLHALRSSKEFKKILNHVPSILSAKRILIAIDTIESYKIYKEGMIQGLRGIVESVNGILTDDNFRRVGIRFFVPAEIFEDVCREIPAKTMPNTVFLIWRAGDLFTMMSLRYLEMMERNKIVTGGEAPYLHRLVDLALEKIGSDDESDGRMLRKKFWYEEGFFPPKIKNSLGYDEDTFAYILRHTQRRPREMNFVMNEIIRRAHAKKRLPKIPCECIKDAIHSRKTLQVLLNDTISPYEGYVRDIADRIGSVFYGKKRIMTGVELKKFSKSIHDLGKLEDMQSDQFVKYLLRSGLLGLCKNQNVLRDGKKRNYCIGKFEYLMHDHITMNNELLYCVHPMLGDFFNMDHGTESGGIYPEPEDDKWLEEELGIGSD